MTNESMSRLTTAAVLQLIALALCPLSGVGQEAPARPDPTGLTYQVFLVGNTGA
jgi:hypothetical protein